MYDIIKSLRPYFFSLREIKDNVSLDLKLPSSWKYEKVVATYKSLQVKVQDKNDKDVLVSFVSTATQLGYDTTFKCANEVVEKNLEEEQKRELFDKKVREMREMFESLGLDELQRLKFDKDESTTEAGLRLVREGDEEGSVGSGESQETDDSTTEEDEEGGPFRSTEEETETK